MNILYDIRSGTLVKSMLYNNGLNISDVLIKKPLIEANFTTGTYKASGANKTFADLFTFTRAGKAWLVKDTGLQEYAADVPRLDSGLLIEQSATNFILQSQNMSNSYWLKDNVIASGNIIKQNTSESSHRITTPSRSVPQYNHTRSQTLLIKPNNTRYLGLNAQSGANAQGVILFDLVSMLIDSRNNIAVDIEYLTNTIDIKKLGDLLTLSYVVRDTGSWNTITNSLLGMQFYKELSSVITSRSFLGDGTTNFEVIAVDAKVENQVSTMIPTTATPVTRPADYLLNKITGTTVTGDWDSTLNLSIVAGKLVHSGYGRIRSLEIN